VQPIKELSSVARWCAGRGCALIRQLANWHRMMSTHGDGYALSRTCHQKKKNSKKMMTGAGCGGGWP